MQALLPPTAINLHSNAHPRLISSHKENAFASLAAHLHITLYYKPIQAHIKYLTLAMYMSGTQF